MLSVGREIYISEQQVLCRSCLWEGAGSQLATGLMETRYPETFLYAYRCPECGDFDTARKGRVLEFSSRHTTEAASNTDNQLKDLPRYPKEYTTNGKRWP